MIAIFIIGTICLNSKYFLSLHRAHSILCIFFSNIKIKTNFKKFVSHLFAGFDGPETPYLRTSCTTPTRALHDYIHTGDVSGTTYHTVGTPPGRRLQTIAPGYGGDEQVRSRADEHSWIFSFSIPAYVHTGDVSGTTYYTVATPPGRGL
jgi:hypothetical protein